MYKVKKKLYIYAAFILMISLLAGCASGEVPRRRIRPVKLQVIVKVIQLPVRLKIRPE